MNNLVEKIIWNKLKNDGGGEAEAIETTQGFTGGSSSNGYILQDIKKLPEININFSGCNYLFYNMKKLEEVTLNFKTKPTTMTSMFQGCNNIKKITIKGEDTSSCTNFSGMYSNCKNLTEFPELNLDSASIIEKMFEHCDNMETAPEMDLSAVQQMKSLFSQCGKLKNVPEYLWLSATDLRYMFELVPNLTDESINNILYSCTTATNYTYTKTLASLGFKATNYPASRIQALENYSDFLASGWTIGY